MSENRIEPQPVIDLVESYISQELRDFQRYENRSSFDSSGVWSLHQLAREVYALGVKDGAAQEGSRNVRQAHRDRGAAGAQQAERNTPTSFDIRPVTLPDFLIRHMPLWDADRCACGTHFGPDRTGAGREWAEHVARRLTNRTDKEDGAE
jgi:hypothetical protein